MANDVSSASVPMDNARFGRLLSDTEMSELARRQRHYDAWEHAAAAGLPPPMLDYDGNPLTVMMARDARRAAPVRPVMQAAGARLGQGGQGDVDKFTNDAAKMALEAAAFEGLGSVVKGAASSYWKSISAPSLDLSGAVSASGRAVTDLAGVVERRAALDYAHQVVPAIRDRVAAQTAARMAELEAMPRDWSKMGVRAGRGTSMWRMEADLDRGFSPGPSGAVIPSNEPWGLGSGYGDAGATYGARIFYRRNAVSPGAARGNAVASGDAGAPSFLMETDPTTGETVNLLENDAARRAMYEDFIASPEAAKAKYGYNMSKRPVDWIQNGGLPAEWKKELYDRYDYLHKHGQFKDRGVSYFESKPFRDVPFNSDEVGLVGLDDLAPEKDLLRIEAKLDKLGIPHVRYRSADDRAASRGFRDLQETRNLREQAGKGWDWRPQVVDEAELHRYAPVFQDAKGGDTRADAKGGDAPGPEMEVSEPPVSEPAPQDQGGPRIVVNPTTFKNKKDALCVAFNEAFRILMEDMSFSPVSEPTDKQRKFFSDTAYANDEEQLRRTIIARIATFDTSVKDPTDEQLQETMEFLEGVMEAGYPQNEWEQSSVQRIHDVIAKAVGAPPAEEPPAEEPPAEEPPAEKATQADEEGGKTQESDDLYLSGINGSDGTIIAAAAAGSQRPANAQPQQPADAQPQQPADAQPQQPADAQPQQPADAQQNSGPAMGPAKKVAPVFGYFEIANQRRKTMYGDLD